MPPLLLQTTESYNDSDPDIAAMAKTWAFPDDLHLYPVRSVEGYLH